MHGGAPVGRAKSAREEHDRRSWCETLKRLARLPSSQLLEAMLNPRNGFNKFLSSYSRDLEAVRIAVILLERASSNSLPSQNLMDLLSVVAFAEPFMLFQLPLLLADCKANEDHLGNFATIRRLISLLTCLQASLPATTAQQLVTLLPAMQDIVKSMNGTVMYGDPLVTKLSELEAMKDTFLAETHAREMVKQERLHASSPPDNFRDVPAIPLVSELTACTKPFLRPNLVRGAYVDADHYLDVQYRLLREDFVRPLRDGLHKLLQNGMKNVRVDNINVYHDVKVLDSEITMGGVVHTLGFDASRFRKINWERTKRFMNDNLLCLSNDGFRTIFFATVKARDPQDLKVGKLTVLFESLFVETVSWNRYTLVETQIYFEAYKHNLLALQDIRAGALPFYRYIVKATPEVDCPAYMNDDTVYDISPLCKRPSPPIRVLKDNEWPPLEDLQLDESQLAAVKMALLKEFSVIQGPPGTGKTYIGLKVVELLLNNIDVWRGNGLPILVVCYTNHALDQFLEGILRTTNNIVRIGGRCSSEKLQPYTLFSQRRVMHRRNVGVLDTYSTLQKKLRKLSVEMSAIYAITCRYVDLEKYMSQRAQDSFREYSYAVRKGFGIWLQLSALKKEFTNELLLESQNKVDQDNPEKDEVDEREFDEEQAGERDDGDELYRRTGRPATPGAFAASNMDEATDKEVDEEYAWCLHLYELVSDEDRAEDDSGVVNVWHLHVNERWRLYRYWASAAIQDMQEDVAEVRAGMAEVKERIMDEQLEHDLVAISDALVVGATTTGAAKNRALIQRVRPRIVIVEEAAEVLEAHVVTSLTSDTKHLILIGDHKQLRPSSAVYELAKRYKMEISLFERMLTNGMACQQLQVQHRMRPEFAKLLVPHFYEKLENFPSVERYEDVRGIDCNLFFVTHNIFEADVADSKSHTNLHEARFVLCLAEYLLNQEYEPDQITILTAYSGQMFLLKDLAKGRPCSGVRVTVVDNFQGEENDIIIFSFVRSNPEKKVGFVKTPNRVCVSLSRARKGLYCIGNFDFIGQSSEEWKNIMKELQGQNAVGQELQLRCPNHPDTITGMRTADDFVKVPEGGCDLQCTVRLDCGHSCGLLCHGYDRFHEAFKCKKQCERKCHNGHCCKLLCSDDCAECTVLVFTEFESCGHSCEIPCRQTVTPRCPLPCREIFACGHKCPKECGEKCPYFCELIVTVKGMCGHDITAQCFEATRGDMSSRCKAQCEKTLSCGHRCLRECKQHCSCTTSVMATGECGHESEVPCTVSKSPAVITRKHCNHPCKKMLKCGHPCAEVCKASCTELCEAAVTVDCKRGHTEQVPCFTSAFHKCTKQCNKVLDCGHQCPKKCFESCTEFCEERVQIERDCGHFIEVDCCKRNSVGALLRPCKIVVPVKCASGHTVQVTCHYSNSVPAIQLLCKARCSKMLTCGHQCALLCKEICSTSLCQVKTVVDRQCGHQLSVPCHVKLRLEDLKEKPEELELYNLEHKSALTCTKQVPVTCTAGHGIKVSCSKVDTSMIVPRSYCNATCNAVLPCGHSCTSTCCKCAEAKDGDHLPCTNRCQKDLPCGHACTDICSKPCAMCQERCQSFCVHGTCSLPCGYPCLPCSLPCAWKCEHAKCTASCSEPCNRQPCNKPCLKKLPCKHPCLGYCGEPCPNVCKVCRTSNYWKYAKGDHRFVLLLDCRHSFPDEVLSQLFQKAKEDQTGPVQCPECRQKITFNFRYSSFVREYMAVITKEKMLIYDRTPKPEMFASPQTVKVNGAAFQTRSKQKWNSRRGNVRGQRGAPGAPQRPPQQQRDTAYGNGAPPGGNRPASNTQYFPGQQNGRGNNRGRWNAWRGSGPFAHTWHAPAAFAPRGESAGGGPRNTVPERAGDDRGRSRGRGDRGGRGRGGRGRGGRVWWERG